MTAFEAYEAYIALKKHFDHKSSYDFFKYHGKMKLNKSSFDTRRDKFYFKKIANLFPMRDDLVNFYVSGFIRNPKMWIRDFVGVEADNFYIKWKAYQESLGYNFQQDVTRVYELCDGDWVSTLRCNGGQHPELLNYYTNNEIQMESMIGLNVVLSFFDDLNNTIDDPIIWPGLYKTFTQYQPFLRIDPKRYKKIVKGEFLKRN